MKAIIIDDIERDQIVGFTRFGIDYSKSPPEIAEELVKQKGIETDPENCFYENKPKADLLHIFINIEGIYGTGCKRQEQKGVEILMWLRCKHLVCNPVILYSFQSTFQLLKKEPKNLIITSEGCYHYQLPFDFSILQNKNFPGIRDIENLKKYIKPAFDITQFRHSHSNWWGVKCLWDVQRIISRKNIQDFPYPEKIYRNLEFINNEVASFLFSIDSISIGKALNEKKSLDNGDSIFCKINKSWELVEIIDSNNNQFSKLNFIENLSYALTLKKPKILLIDDKADDGWSEIYQTMIYNGYPNSNFVRIIPRTEFKNCPEKLYKNIINPSINSLNPDVIFLDLRLFDEQDKSIEVDKISGKIVLDLLRDEFLGIPVIMTTASNKIWTYNALMNLGADGYWIKEGIDELRDSRISLENYINLLKLVTCSCDKNYKFLRNFELKIEALKKDNLKGLSTNQKSKIIMTFEIVKIMIKDYLQKFKMEFGYQSNVSKSFLLCSIINKLGFIVELVYDIEQIKTADLIQNNDNMGLAITAYRNTASHHKDSYNCKSFDHIINMTYLIMNYLQDTKKTYNRIYLNKAKNWMDLDIKFREFKKSNQSILLD